ncbi:hypothetical protein CONPUDRAFT_121703 [Coniophora puteana RWD-64-598 SS2]|uniref:RING-type domain-containing protein n=1 Tax=Coniophora puteana (strain RWD-64-598) TaxID=741705 RepID=A0A5M3MW54_CONPW|nr:uncharacterized protein CONPUDRAFT_121703 [Coniophora puteana RWD-64-598 SS2]EIW83217.1 hypothetical protein CONPUDRAFT_121703 [Coniophora puteana RWD-64-598 SS2]
MADSPATPPPDLQYMRRTQSLGDLPSQTVQHPSRARVSGSHRPSEQLSRVSGPHSTGVHTLSEGSHADWSTAESPQAINGLENGHGESAAASISSQQPWRSRLKTFFGYGPHATKTRKALVSLCGNLAYGILQVIGIIVVLSVASVVKSPKSDRYQISTCDRPLVAWNCIWIARVCLSCVLSYWNYLRMRASDGPSVDIESPRPPDEPISTSARRQASRRSNSSPGTSAPAPSRRSEAGNQSAPNLPHSQLYARLSLLSSMLTLTWFLTAHILEYTSIESCRLSSPLVWWLTFGVLCTMYIVVMEVILFGLLVFMILPFIMLFYSIVLLCLGRHPLQNPHYIKPEIGKLPKALVDRIPLVIYIPTPPDDSAYSHTLALPKPAHSYPPKPQGKALPRRRFAFLRRATKKDKAGNPLVGDGKKAPKDKESKGASEEETWEDLWEAAEYPFVRLEGNRAVCAICLMDFEEPKRVGKADKEAEAGAETGAEGEGTLVPAGQEPTTEGEVHIPVERITEEERDVPRLEDAGEGPQPLRLLACGHVFHKTCIDPWLTDVSGRCPVCQRPVEIEEDEKKSKRRRRPRPPPEAEEP